MATAIRTRKNQYRGINAHLHSFWQAENKWNRFHNAHAMSLMTLLKWQLLQIDYICHTEASLQYFDADDHYFSAIAIYERKGENPSDEPIGWLEVLSPTNKGNTKDAGEYRYKRQQLLKAGCVFIKLDYLHATPPTWDTLPDYTLREEKSHAYRIMVLVPCPDAIEGYAYLYEFDVDMPLPQVVIPLSGDDKISFDFDAAYQKTFVEGSYGFDRELDYRHFPMQFDSYSDADKTHIARRMLIVLQAQQRGENLENAPFPADDALSLVAASSSITELLA